MPPAAAATVATPAEVQVGTAMLIAGAIAWDADSAGRSMGSAIADCRIGMLGTAKPIVPLARSINASEARMQGAVWSVILTSHKRTAHHAEQLLNLARVTVTAVNGHGLLIYY